MPAPMLSKLKPDTLIKAYIPIRALVTIIIFLIRTNICHQVDLPYQSPNIFISLPTKGIL